MVMRRVSTLSRDCQCGAWHIWITWTQIKPWKSTDQRNPLRENSRHRMQHVAAPPRVCNNQDSSCQPQFTVQIKCIQMPSVIRVIQSMGVHHTKDGDEKSLYTQSRLSVWCMTHLNHLDTNQTVKINWSEKSAKRKFTPSDAACCCPSTSV